MDVGDTVISVEGGGRGCYRLRWYWPSGKTSSGNLQKVLEIVTEADEPLAIKDNVEIDDRVGEMEAARVLGIDDVACGVSGMYGK